MDFYLGHHYSGNPGNSYFFDGEIAECAAWTAKLSAGEVRSLYSGASPLFVQPGKLRGYWPLGGPLVSNSTGTTNAYRDVLGTYNLGENGDPTFVETPMGFGSSSGMFYPQTYIANDTVPFTQGGESESEEESSDTGAATGSGEISLSSQDVAMNIIQTNHVDDASMAYLKEIAFGFEYGSASEIIRKWPSNVYIKAHWVNNDGSSATPDSDDAAQLAAVVSELNDLINTVEIELINDGSSNVCTSDTHTNNTSGCAVEPVNGKVPNINIYFTTQARYEIINTSYVAGNTGFFAVSYGGARAGLTRASIYVKSSASLAARKHLIREEITQAMGLGKDSDIYTDSIFRQSGGVNTDYYTEIDRNIIRMLYDSRIINGMDKDTAEKALTDTSAYIAGRNWKWGGDINNKPRKSLSTLDNRFVNDGR